MSAACAPSRSAIRGTPGLSGHDCPECAKRFHKGHPRQLFCSTAHKREREARARRRGAQLYIYAAVARITRGGTRGKIITGHQAQVDSDLLLQRWRDEDAAANDGKGRMSEADYLNLRYTYGYERP